MCTYLRACVGGESSWGYEGYLVRVVKGDNAQWPEAAKHGKDGEAQMVPGRQHNEVVLALAVTGAVALEGGTVGLKLSALSL